MKTIEYFFSPSSPFSYLGQPALVDIARRHEASIVYRPANFAEVFAQTGGLMLSERPPSRQAHRLIELQRWSRRRALPIVLHPKHHFGPREVTSGLIIAAQADGEDCADLTFALMRACWAEDRDIGDVATLAAILNEVKLSSRYLDVAGSREVQAKLSNNTQTAIQRQYFGSPTYVVDGEMFWGQDRLDFVEEALQNHSP